MLVSKLYFENLTGGHTWESQGRIVGLEPPILEKQRILNLLLVCWCLVQSFALCMNHVCWHGFVLFSLNSTFDGILVFPLSNCWWENVLFVVPPNNEVSYLPLLGVTYLIWLSWWWNFANINVLLERYRVIVGSLKPSSIVFCMPQDPPGRAGKHCWGGRMDRWMDGWMGGYSALQKYSPPLNFSTFCHILTTDVNVLYWDFMW